MRKFAMTDVEEAAGTGYPDEYAGPCRNRMARRLTQAAGLTQFGVNMVRLTPGSWTGQRHWHSHEDEFVWIVEGEAVLVSDEGETPLKAGDCVGYPAGEPNGHHIQNRSDRDVLVFTVGTRSDEDAAVYPDIDMQALPGRYSNPDCFRRKDGSRFDGPG